MELKEYFPYLRELRGLKPENPFNGIESKYYFMCLIGGSAGYESIQWN